MVNRLTDAYNQSFGVQIDARLNNYGYRALLRKITKEEDQYEDQKDVFSDPVVIYFGLRLPTENSLVGASLNVFMEEGLPATGFFRSKDNVEVGDIIELQYPITFNGKYIKYLEAVRLRHQYGIIVVYEIGTYKGDLEPGAELP